MLVREEAIVCAVRAHGENGAVVRLMTAGEGLVAGYQRGRSRRGHAVFTPGDRVLAALTTRPGQQLPALTMELIESRAPLMTEPLAAAALDWVTSLTAVAVPEGHRYPRIHAALTALTSAIAHAPAARDWAGAVGRYEAIVAADLGYGIDALPEALFAALRATGAVLADELLTGRRATVLAARERLLTRLHRALDP